MYGLQALCLGHKSMAKNLVHNLQYEPKTWLIRGIYGTILSATEEVKRVLKGRCTEHLWHTHPQNNLGGIYDLASEIFDVCSKTFNIKIAKKMSMHATSRNIIALKSSLRIFLCNITFREATTLVKKNNKMDSSNFF